MTSRQDFVSRFGGIFEHSAWVAERAYDARPDMPLTAEDVHAAMVVAFRNAAETERLEVLRAHPDLAGKLALAGGLTADSKAEQASAGLDRLSPAEHARFTELNTAYMEKFGFPFIIAVKGLTKDDILQAFESRIGNTPRQELDTAAAQVEKIAALRLQSILPGSTQ